MNKESTLKRLRIRARQLMNTLISYDRTEKWDDKTGRTLETEEEQRIRHIRAKSYMDEIQSILDQIKSCKTSTT